MLNKLFGTNILISEDVYKYVKNLYNVDKMDKIKGKEKETPLDEDGPNTIEELRKFLGKEEQFLKYKKKDVS